MKKSEKPSAGAIVATVTTAIMIGTVMAVGAFTPTKVVSSEPSQAPQRVFTIEEVQTLRQASTVPLQAVPTNIQPALNVR